MMTSCLQSKVPTWQHRHHSVSSSSSSRMMMMMISGTTGYSSTLGCRASVASRITCSSSGGGLPQPLLPQTCLSSSSSSRRLDILTCRYRPTSPSPADDPVPMRDTTNTVQTPSSSSSSTTTATTTAAAAAAANPTTTPTPAKQYRGTAVVVGAGPAGSTAAMYLARSGFRVHVIERRGHPGKMEADIKRTYLIGLGERGLRPLDGLGISVPLSVGRPMRGSVYAYKSGKRVEDPFTPDTRIVGVDRQGLAAFLVDQAQQQYADAITFHWHVQPSEFDFKAKCISTSREQQRSSNGAMQQPGTGTAAAAADSLPRQLHYDLLVGADGASSAVRAALVDAVPGMKVEQLTSPVAEMEYKAFHNLPWNNAIQALLPKYNAAVEEDDAAAAAAAAAAVAATTPGMPAIPAAAANAPAAAAADVHGLGEGMTFFAFNNPQPNQPSPGSITLYLNAAGLWSGTVYQPPGKYDAMHGDTAAHEAAIRQFTPETFPDEWVPEMAKQMADIKPSRINPMRLVSDLAAPSLGVVLLGDAAHNVTPQMGQGCNSALEDAALLEQALSSSNYNLAAGLQKFEQQRKPQVHSLQRMEEENSWVRRPARLLQDPIDKTLARFAWISFFMLLPLLRLLPGMKQYVHASLFQTIMSTTIPYNKLHKAIRAAPFAVLGLLGGLVYGLYWVVRHGICLALGALSRL